MVKKLIASLFAAYMLVSCSQNVSAKSINATKDQQAEYENYDVTYLNANQTIDKGINIDLTNAAVIDTIAGNNDWHLSKGELDKFLEAVESNNKFFAVIEPKCKFSDICYTNNPTDYLFSGEQMPNVNLSGKSVESLIKKIEGDLNDNGSHLGYVKIKLTMNKDGSVNLKKPFEVAAPYVNEDGSFVEKDVTKYSLKKQLAKEKE
jgi:hypothetical protein